ncbi:MAG: DUF1295 domain-containing protein [Verrucomicrobia bacterium]|nr:MAG: DUF1295 domain-containing protein [Verrucomicrobiota bacterium]
MSSAIFILTALAGLSCVFTLGYLLARRWDNYGVVDVIWSYAFAALALYYSALAEGWWVRRLVLVLMVGAWSMRLGTHLLLRVSRDHPREDGRYQAMRDAWKGGFGGRMFGFFQLQAVSVVLLGLPFFWIARNPVEEFHLMEWLGMALWTAAIAGEAVADAQLAAFRRERKDRRAVCDIGLWRYSRHPNYFFEWLVWVGFFLFACGSPWGWTGVLSPLVILYLILRVTGIPPTEAQALRSKGEAYAKYQARTNAFFPGPPRASVESISKSPFSADATRKQS